jgi:adenosylcobinamide-GDP ribazoletransferase
VTSISGELETFFGALRFFTRIPVPAWVGHSAEGLNRSARYFPAIGIIVGALSACVFTLAASGWPTSIAVLLALGASAWITGAFHEDGLCDAADGLGGGYTRERAMEIMKDSRAGSYGVLALTLVTLGRLVTLAALPPVWIPAALVAGHTVSRFASTALIAALDYARDDSGKAKPLATRLGGAGLALAAAFALLAAAPLVYLAGWPQALLAAGFMVAVTIWLARLFVRRLGGYTGDCLGATQQASELACYLGLACSFS